MTLPANATIKQVTDAYKAGTDTSQGFCGASLTRISASTLNAVVTVRPCANVMADAAASDARYAANAPLSPIDGVPFTLKTVHATNGVRTTNGEGIDDTPIYDGDIAAKLKAAGAILLGKTNVGSNPAQGKSTLFGETHNPLNPLYATGGSSCGSAAAVSANLSVFDVGVDAAGSIRIPASFCGVAGLKPTRHAVSDWGDYSVQTPSCPPYGTLDTYHYGPLARSLDDLLTVLDIIAGATQNSPEAPMLKPATSPTLAKVLKIDHIGPTASPWYLSPYVQSKLDSVCSAMATSGILVDYKALTWFDHPGFDNAFNGLQDEALLAGYSTTPPASRAPWTVAGLNFAANHVSTQQQARAAIKGYQRALGIMMGDSGSTRGATDIIITGTTALAPPLYGAAPDPTHWISYMAFTGLFDLTGHPALTIPAGIDPVTGTGFGIQLIGRIGEDRDLIALGKQVQAFI